MAPENSASTAGGPALNERVSSLVSPRLRWKMPSWMPTRAVAWVRFGKYPSRREAGWAPPSEEPDDPLEQAPTATVRASAAAAASQRRTRTGRGRPALGRGSVVGPLAARQSEWFAT